MSFDSFKNLGNQIFQKTYQDLTLSPVLYKERICQALQYYNKASNLARNAKEKSSILKNIAASQFRIGEKCYNCYQQLTKSTRQSRNSKSSSSTLITESQYFLEESLKNFMEAIEIGKSIQEPAWIVQMTEKQHQCAELLWNSIISQDHVKWPVLCGQLHQLCLKLTGPIRAKLFLKLGRLTFQKAVKQQENGRMIQSLQLLHDNYQNIEEAKRLENQLDEVIELEESNYTHLCIGNSTMARQRGDKLWTEATCQEENIQMELVWDAVDCYVQSIVCSREKSLEYEAIAHSHLGRLYELLIVNEKSHEHYKRTVDLVVAMAPKNFNEHSWYKQALAGLHKFQEQQKWSENKEREKIRAPFRAELKDVLDELKKASGKSAQELIDLIYSKHPPKRGEKPSDGGIKAKLKIALLHYHPDKQDLETNGLKWIILSEEITILLNHHFERVK